MLSSSSSSSLVVGWQISMSTESSSGDSIIGGNNPITSETRIEVSSEVSTPSSSTTLQVDSEREM